MCDTLAYEPSTGLQAQMPEDTFEEQYVIAVAGTFCMQCDSLILQVHTCSALSVQPLLAIAIVISDRRCTFSE